MNKEVMTRRIDDLGRVSIPKEIRKNLKLNENDDVTIVEQDGKIIIRKVNYDIKDIANSISCYINNISDMLKANVLITDLESVIMENQNPRALSISRINCSFSLSFISAIKHKSPIGKYKDETEISYNGKPYVTSDDLNNQRLIPYVISYIYDKNNNVLGSVVIYNTTPESKIMADSIAALIMAKM